MHNGGSLLFDTAGNLLISTGDAAHASLAQRLDSLNGKILRIRPRPEGGYDIPADNPYVGLTGEDSAAGRRSMPGACAIPSALHGARRMERFLWPTWAK